MCVGCVPPDTIFGTNYTKAAVLGLIRLLSYLKATCFMVSSDAVGIRVINFSSYICWTMLYSLRVIYDYDYASCKDNFCFLFVGVPGSPVLNFLKCYFFIFLSSLSISMSSFADYIFFCYSSIREFAAFVFLIICDDSSIILFRSFFTYEEYISRGLL